MSCNLTACWASSGYSAQGCVALEQSLRACMDAPVRFCYVPSFFSCFSIPTLPFSLCPSSVPPSFILYPSLLFICNLLSSLTPSLHSIEGLIDGSTEHVLPVVIAWKRIRANVRNRWMNNRNHPNNKRTASIIISQDSIRS